jgi:hypothetical protein
MHYENVRKRVKRIAKDYKDNKKSDKELQRRLVGSLIDQAGRHEGEGAKDELRKELDTNNHSGNKLGWSKRYEKNWEAIFKKVPEGKAPISGT